MVFDRLRDDGAPCNPATVQQKLLDFFLLGEGGESCLHLLKVVDHRSLIVAFNARIALGSVIALI